VYKLGVMAFNCLHGQAPPYLVELCQPVAGVALWQRLRSATRQLLVVPAQHLQPTGCLCGWSVGLEFPAGELAGDPVIDGKFQTIVEDVSICSVY